MYGGEVLAVCGDVTPAFGQGAAGVLVVVVRGTGRLAALADARTRVAREASDVRR